MPGKCNKVKNPCKICLASVTKATGLQCQGACKKWVHFACLNYTPGKIRDIKQGIIKVTCPCPDCKTTVPKEFRTDEPYSCTNVQCPSNLPRSCTTAGCPSNAMNQTSGCGPLLFCEKTACKKSACRAPPPPPPPKGPCPAPPPICGSSPPSCSPSPCGSPSGNSISFCPSSGDMASPSMNVVEQLCTTVGQLTNQINRLMCEMRTMKNGRSPKRGCDQPGSRNKCQKPCFCPNNPQQ